MEGIILFSHKLSPAHNSLIKYKIKEKNNLFKKKKKETKTESPSLKGVGMSD